jgi:hypothetical protein
MKNAAGFSLPTSLAACKRKIRRALREGLTGPRVEKLRSNRKIQRSDLACASTPAARERQSLYCQGVGGCGGRAAFGGWIALWLPSGGKLVRRPARHQQSSPAAEWFRTVNHRARRERNPEGMKMADKTKAAKAGKKLVPAKKVEKKQTLTVAFQ